MVRLKLGKKRAPQLQEKFCKNEAKEVWSSQIQVEFYDLSGQIVWQQILPVNNGKLQQVVRTSGLSKGVYDLQLRTDQGSKVQKLVLEWY